MYTLTYSHYNILVEKIIFQAYNLLDPISHKTPYWTVREEVILVKEGIILKDNSVSPSLVDKRKIRHMFLSLKYIINKIYKTI